jgi:NAD(P)-dependent dehydrogenase (short-subunit alcohol dehydrogenase family)
MTTPPGRTAIIIGASSGIGEALARELNESVLDECGGADLQASSAVG